MNYSKQWLDCAQLRDLDLVDYLAKVGNELQKIRNHDYWYLSPLRTETTASFKVNRKLNRWYDHGLGQGGNLVDFAVLYHNCTIAELLQHLQGSLSLHEPLFNREHETNSSSNAITILGVFTLNSFGLINYLEDRRIPFELAARYCREVRYKLNKKIYYSIGFRNDEGRI